MKKYLFDIIFFIVIFILTSIYIVYINLNKVNNVTIETKHYVKQFQHNDHDYLEFNIVSTNTWINIVHDPDCKRCNNFQYNGQTQRIELNADNGLSAEEIENIKKNDKVTVKDQIDPKGTQIKHVEVSSKIFSNSK